MRGERYQDRRNVEILRITEMEKAIERPVKIFHTQ